MRQAKTKARRGINPRPADASVRTASKKRKANAKNEGEKRAGFEMPRLSAPSLIRPLRKPNENKGQAKAMGQDRLPIWCRRIMFVAPDVPAGISHVITMVAPQASPPLRQRVSTSLTIARGSS